MPVISCTVSRKPGFLTVHQWDKLKSVSDDLKRSGMFFQHMYAHRFQISLVSGIDRPQHTAYRTDIFSRMAENIDPRIPESETASLFQPFDVPVCQFLCILCKFIQILR